MTVIVGWIPFEKVGESYYPASAYIASDSRVTQEHFKNIDCAQKVFFSQKSPNIFGFCGDVIAGMNLISHAITLLDAGIGRETSIEERFKLVSDLIERDDIQNRKVTIMHVTRKGYRGFGCCCYSVQDGKCTMKVYPIESNSQKPFSVVLGTGTSEYKTKYATFEAGNSAKTSRNVFQALGSMIASVATPSCGGSIQLVGLYHEGYGRPFGYVQDDSVFLCGHKVPKELIPGDIELRNSLFERCEHKTLMLIKGAQAQPNELL